MPSARAAEWRKSMEEIKLSGVSKKIRGVWVLRDINLTMKPGTIYGLRGKNGCGKTMLMRAICGLILPTEGEVSIDGKVLHQDIAYPQSLGALIENPSFLSQYTGLQNLRMLGSIQGKVRDEELRLALTRAGLDPEDKRTYRKYSLGMKQKLGIANAIMGEPDLIVLDEPINALDEESVKGIKEVLIGLRDRGKLIIIACHDKEELEYLSDTIFVMKEGSIVGTEGWKDENHKTLEA